MACIVFEEPNVRGNNRWERISSSSMCVCELASALTFAASGPVVCASATSVCLCLCILACLHLCILSMSCRDVQGSRAQSSQSMKWWNAHVAFVLHKCRAWLGLIAWHFSAPRYQGLITLLPSRLIWGVQILSSTVLHSPTRSYYVCWKHSDDSFQDTVSNELGKQQANLGVDLHEFQTSASVPRRYLSGVWNMTKMDEPCCVGQALHFKAVCQSRSAMHQQTNFPAEHHHFSRRIKSNDQTSNTLNWLSWLSPFSQSPMACATGACGAITTYPLYISQILTVSHD